LSNKERQAAYRERMYAAGYRQKQVWVSEDVLLRKEGWAAFRFKFREVTALLTKKEMERLYRDIIKLATARAKEAKAKREKK